jgi:hypothetical protein
MSYTWEIGSVMGTPGSDDSIIYCKSATLPTFTVQQEQVVGGSLLYKFAKTVDWADVTISFYDCKGTLATLKQWREAVWKPSSGFQPVRQYKKTTTLNTFLPTGENVNNFRLIGSWPSKIAHADLTYTATDVKEVIVNISYDYAEDAPG